MKSAAAVRVVNVSRGLVLAARAGLARSVLARTVGLLGRRALLPGEGLVLAPCGSVHTFGMRLTIDAVFVDGAGGGGRVLRVARLPPWRLGPLVRGARAVVELPAGAAGATVAGDVLQWEPLTDSAGPSRRAQPP